MLLFQRFIPAIPAFALAAITTYAAELQWAQFRGPNGSGVADSQKLPAEFGPGTNEVFKVVVPPGASSPCIAGDRVFLTALEDGKLVTIAYGARDGKLLWRREAPFEKLEAVLPGEGSPAASTPCTDGERVYSYFGSAGLFAYTVAGEPVWDYKHAALEHTGGFGSGASPIVHDGLVILNMDQLHGAHLLALRADNGRQAWRAERPEFLSSWSTPVVREHKGVKEIVLAGAQRIKGYDLKTGAERWTFHGLPNAVCPTPLLDGEVVYFAAWSPASSDVKLDSFATMLSKDDKNADGKIAQSEVSGGILKMLFTTFDVNGDKMLEADEWETRQNEMKRSVNQAFALRPAAGNLTETNVVWSYTRGLPYVPSSLLYRGNFYMVRDGGMVTNLDAKSGKPHYEQERLGANGNYYPSPVAAGGRIYLCSNDGKITVLAAGEKPEVLYRAELGERTLTTPAIAHHRLYVRSANHLWCFGAAK
jgi:outer membrane protein assembly factor BamB